MAAVRKNTRVGGKIKKARCVQPGMTYRLGKGTIGQVWSAAPAQSGVRGRSAWLVVKHADGSPNRFARASISGGHVERWTYA